MMINLTMPSYLLRTQRPSDNDHKIQGASIPQTLREKPRRSFIQQKPVPPTIEKKPQVHSEKTYFHSEKNLIPLRKKPTMCAGGRESSTQE
jgi:hypothetical protein